MSDETIKSISEQALTKASIVEAVISLSDPILETPESPVQHFLSKDHFLESYKAVLEQTGPILADDLLAEHKGLSSESLLEEGKKLVLWMDKGREAFEYILDYKEKTDTDTNMMNFWKKRDVPDETMELEKYEESKKREPLSGFARSIQAHPVSKQEKIWFLYGGFTWALVRGMPGEAIDCLKYIAGIQESTPNALISHFEPAVSLMHKIATDLDQNVANAAGGLDALGGRSAEEYLLEMDQALVQRGLFFDGDGQLQPAPVLIA